jgi:hypothetical protein
MLKANDGVIGFLTLSKALYLYGHLPLRVFCRIIAAALNMDFKFL